MVFGHYKGKPLIDNYLEVINRKLPKKHGCQGHSDTKVCTVQKWWQVIEGVRVRALLLARRGMLREFGEVFHRLVEEWVLNNP